MQLDLGKRESRSKAIALPPGFLRADYIMSTQVMTFYDGNESYRAYEIWPKQDS